MNLSLLVLSGFWCIGFHVVIKNAILEFGNYIAFELWWDDLPRWKRLIFKPLFACPYCEASIHGTAIHFLTGGSVVMWPIFCICLCGFNYLLSQFINE